MTDLGNSRIHPLSFSPPALPRAAFAGVRSRRIAAFCFDFAIVSGLAFLLYVFLFFATFGLSAFLLPPLWPLTAFLYNGLGVSGRNMATPGMRLLDLEMWTVDGSSVSFLNAGIHAVMLYLSWLFPAVFVTSLFMSDKRCLHDMAAGVIVVRRPDR